METEKIEESIYQIIVNNKSEFVVLGLMTVGIGVLIGVIGMIILNVIKDRVWFTECKDCEKRKFPLLKIWEYIVEDNFKILILFVSAIMAIVTTTAYMLDSIRLDIIFTMINYYISFMFAWVLADMNLSRTYKIKLSESAVKSMRYIKSIQGNIKSSIGYVTERGKDADAVTTVNEEAYRNLVIQFKNVKYDLMVIDQYIASSIEDWNDLIVDDNKQNKDSINESSTGQSVASDKESANYGGLVELVQSSK